MKEHSAQLALCECGFCRREKVLPHTQNEAINENHYTMVNWELWFPLNLYLQDSSAAHVSVAEGKNERFSNKDH